MSGKTQLAELVIKLMRAHPGMSEKAACAQVGMTYITWKRLKAQGIVAQIRGSLPETTPVEQILDGAMASVNGSGMTLAQARAAQVAMAAGRRLEAQQKRQAGSQKVVEAAQDFADQEVSAQAFLDQVDRGEMPWQSEAHQVSVETVPESPVEHVVIPEIPPVQPTVPEETW